MVMRKTPFVFNRKATGEIPRKFQGILKQSRLSCFLATPAVIIARPILMHASKPRPLINQRCVRGSRPDETSQEMTSFRDGQRDQRQ
jgi:hypothetical protein